jgi:group I intron endonuclease
MFVYVIGNLINQKLYVGKANNPDERWKEHLRQCKAGSQYAIHRAIRKYGAQNFKFSVAQSYPNEELAYLGEEIWTARLHSTTEEWGYNMTRAGKGGGVPTEETRRKISQASKRQFESQEARDKLSKSLAQTWECPERRRRASEAQSVAMQNPVKRQMHIEILRNTHLDPEIKARRDQTHRNTMSTPEARLNLSRAITEYFKTPGAKEKASEAQKKRMADPVERELNRQRQIETHTTPEFRERQSKLAIERFSRPGEREKCSAAQKQRVNTPERQALITKIVVMYSNAKTVTQIAKEIGRGYETVRQILIVAGVYVSTRKQKK